MARSRRTLLHGLLDSDRVREAATALVQAVAEEAQERALSREQYERAVRLDRVMRESRGGASVSAHCRAGQRLPEGARNDGHLAARPA